MQHVFCVKVRKRLSIRQVSDCSPWEQTCRIGFIQISFLLTTKIEPLCRLLVSFCVPQPLFVIVSLWWGRVNTNHIFPSMLAICNVTCLCLPCPSIFELVHNDITDARCVCVHCLQARCVTSPTPSFPTCVDTSACMLTAERKSSAKTVGRCLAPLLHSINTVAFVRAKINLPLPQEGFLVPVCPFKVHPELTNLLLE